MGVCVVEDATAVKRIIRSCERKPGTSWFIAWLVFR
jgi:hypothetical protein